MRRPNLFIFHPPHLALLRSWRRNPALRLPLMVVAATVGMCMTAVSMVDERASHANSTLRRFEYRGEAMGSNLDLILYSASELDANQALENALSTLEARSQDINNYAPKSAVSRLSELRPNDELTIAGDLASLLAESKRWFEISEGAFDSTKSELFAVWLRARKDGQKPTPQALERAKRQSGWDQIAWQHHDDGSYTLSHSGSGLSIDLGGLSVGYLIDQMAAALRNDGIESFLIDAGGDIIVGNAPPQRDGWMIDIGGIEQGAPILKRVVLVNSAITTSGDLNQFAMVDGERLSHVIDPRSGQPLTRRSSVTVVAKTGVDADAGATAVSVLGPIRSFQLAGQLPLQEIFVFQQSIDGHTTMRHWTKE